MPGSPPEKSPLFTAWMARKTPFAPAELLCTHKSFWRSCASTAQKRSANRGGVALSRSSRQTKIRYSVRLAGYGNTGPNDCYWGSFLITVQTIIGLFLDSITLGIIFARISHPKNRGRTIGISDSAVISRRDGILKLMFRIADFRETQVRLSPVF